MSTVTFSDGSDWNSSQFQVLAVPSRSLAVNDHVSRGMRGAWPKERTRANPPDVSKSASSTSRDTPSHVVSSLDHLVTQWMSTVTFSDGSDWNSSQFQVLAVPSRSLAVNDHVSRGMRGAWPKERTRANPPDVSKSASSTSRDTPSHVVSSLDHLVTQWMSTVTFSDGSDWNSSQFQVLAVPSRSLAVNDHVSRGMRGAWPKERTRANPPDVSKSASSTSRDTPSHVVSSLDHLVTQWMSTVTFSDGSDWNSSKFQVLAVPSRSLAVNDHVSRGMRGVGPADSTGKSAVTYWPGGTLPSGPSSRRRPRKPRVTKLIVCSSPSDRPVRSSRPPVADPPTPSRSAHRRIA